MDSRLLTRGRTATSALAAERRLPAETTVGMATALGDNLAGAAAEQNVAKLVAQTAEQTALVLVARTADEVGPAVQAALSSQQAFAGTAWRTAPAASSDLAYFSHAAPQFCGLHTALVH